MARFVVTPPHQRIRQRRAFGGERIGKSGSNMLGHDFWIWPVSRAGGRRLGGRSRGSREGGGRCEIPYRRRWLAGTCIAISINQPGTVGAAVRPLPGRRACRGFKPYRRPARTPVGGLPARENDQVPCGGGSGAKERPTLYKAKANLHFPIQDCSPLATSGHINRCTRNPTPTTVGGSIRKGHGKQDTGAGPTVRGWMDGWMGG